MHWILRKKRENSGGGSPGYVDCTKRSRRSARNAALLWHGRWPSPMGLGHNEAFLIAMPLVPASLTVFNPLKLNLPWQIRLPGAGTIVCLREWEIDARSRRKLASWRETRTIGWMNLTDEGFCGFLLLCWKLRGNGYFDYGKILIELHCNCCV